MNPTREELSVRDALLFGELMIVFRDHVPEATFYATYPQIEADILKAFGETDRTLADLNAPAVDE